MIRVTFPLVKTPGTNQVEYPDDTSLFRGATIIHGTTVIANYFGEWPSSIPELEAYSPSATYRTRVRPGEMIALIGKPGYPLIHRAAYPPGAAPGDDDALMFMEQARFPTSGDGFIELTDQLVTDALDYFITKNYIDEADKTRVLQGVSE